MGVRERKVENHLKKEVKKLGGRSRKWVSPGLDGVPDQIAILQGRVTFVEVKTTDGEVSPNQEREQLRLVEDGAAVAVVFGKTGVDGLIRSFQTQHWQQCSDYYNKVSIHK